MNHKMIFWEFFEIFLNRAFRFTRTYEDIEFLLRIWYYGSSQCSWSKTGKVRRSVSVDIVLIELIESFAFDTLL